MRCMRLDRGTACGRALRQGYSLLNSSDSFVTLRLHFATRPKVLTSEPSFCGYSALPRALRDRKRFPHHTVYKSVFRIRVSRALASARVRLPASSPQRRGRVLRSAALFLHCFDAATSRCALQSVEAFDLRSFDQNTNLNTI